MFLRNATCTGLASTTFGSESHTLSADVPLEACNMQGFTRQPVKCDVALKVYQLPFTLLSFILSLSLYLSLSLPLSLSLSDTHARLSSQEYFWCQLSLATVWFYNHVTWTAPLSFLFPPSDAVHPPHVCPPSSPRQVDSSNKSLDWNLLLV